jgi:hypothetical protein
MRPLPAFVGVMAATLALTVVAPVASAEARALGGAWSRPEVVVTAGCEPDFATAAAASGPDGRAHGFASYVRGTCTGDPVWYFQGTMGHWTRARSPYRGDVLSVASDHTGTWVLYLGGASYDRVLLGRRLSSGAFAAPQVVSRLVGSAVGSGVQGASLVASGGRWWAVWAQALPDPTSSAPGTTLFEAGTLGGVRKAHRITTAPAGYQETRPSLALTTNRAGRPTGAVLAWARDVGSPVTGVQNDELWYGQAGLNGRWTARVVVRATVNPYALFPVLARDGGTTWLAWQRRSMDFEGPADSRALVTKNPALRSKPHMFATGGDGVVVMAGTGKAYLAWQSSRPGTLAVAVGQGGRWTEQNVVLDAGGMRAHPLLVATQRGRLTVLAQFHGADGRVVATFRR